MAGLVLTMTIAIWFMAKGATQASSRSASAARIREHGSACRDNDCRFGALAHNPADALGLMTLISGFAVLPDRRSWRSGGVER
jgi:hypothetical protein